MLTGVVWTQLPHRKYSVSEVTVLERSLAAVPLLQMMHKGQKKSWGENTPVEQMCWIGPDCGSHPVRPASFITSSFLPVAKTFMSHFSFVSLNETQADPGSWWIQEALLWSCISPSGAHPIFHLTGCSRAVTPLASPRLAEVRYMLQFFCPSGRLGPALDALRGSGERGCTLQLHKRSGQVSKKHIRVASFCDLQWSWREPPSSAEHKGWRLRWKNAKIITERSLELSN